jgi:hypothetical protein
MKRVDVLHGTRQMCMQRCTNTCLISLWSASVSLSAGNCFVGYQVFGLLGGWHCMAVTRGGCQRVLISVALHLVVSRLLLLLRCAC